jgi:hypothetical protein
MNDLEKRVFNDSIDNVTIIFYSDASQKLITALEINPWYVTKHILEDFNYKVIENNPN